MRFFPLLIAVASFIRAEIFVDTIGWTTRDRQFHFPALRYLVNDTLRGIHAVYKDGYGEIRYNFKPRGEDWRFPEAIVINPYQRNLGCLDINNNGRTLIATDYRNRGDKTITYFLDSAPGAAVFQEIAVTEGLQYPLVGIGRYGYLKFAAIGNDTLYYFSPFTRYRVGVIGSFPTHNLIASKISSRLGFIWSEKNSGKLFLRETPDGGGTWYPLRNLSENIPTRFNRSLFGASAVYDSIRIHLVADLIESTNRGIVQLWHYCPYDTPAWHFIYEYAITDTTVLGIYTAAIDRPSIGIERRTGTSGNRLYVVWEQFNPENIDPRTGIARTDIWASCSPDNGRTWTQPIRLTTPDSISKRFPYLAEVVNDTLHIIYFADLVAGSWELGEGPITRNPVIYLRVPASVFTAGVKEKPLFNIPPGDFLPTLFTGGKELPLYRSCRVFNSSGRLVPGDPLLLPSGVYFIVMQTGNSYLIQPLIKIR